MTFSALEYPSVGAPAVYGGKVYIMAGQQTSTAMFGFDAASGSQLFTGRSSAQWETFYAPIVVGDLVVTNAGSGSLQAFKTSDGSSPWWLVTGSTGLWSPASDGQYIYSYNAGNNSGALTVSEIATGNTVKSIADERFQQFAYELSSAPVLGAPGSVFGVNVATSRASADASYARNRLVNFDVAGGKIKWALEGVYSSTPAYANGVVYLVNHAPFRLEARTEADGALLWNWVPPDAYLPQVDTNELLLTKNLLFVRMLGRTYAVDLASHKDVWKIDKTGTLALSANDLLYISTDTTVIAMNVK